MKKLTKAEKARLNGGVRSAILEEIQRVGDLDQDVPVAYYKVAV